MSPERVPRRTQDGCSMSKARQALQTVVETTSMEAWKDQILVSVTLLDVQRWSLSVRPVILIDAACAAYHTRLFR